MRRWYLALPVLAALFLTFQAALALPDYQISRSWDGTYLTLDFDTTDGTNLSALAKFWVDEDEDRLCLELTNDSTANSQQNDLLGGFFFELPTGMTLSGGEAKIGAAPSGAYSWTGSAWTVFPPPPDSPFTALTDIGAEWGYSSDGDFDADLPGAMNAGVSALGYGFLDSPAYKFDPPGNLSGPWEYGGKTPYPIDGPDYALLSSTGTGWSGNEGPYIVNTALFCWTDPGIDLSEDVGEAWFQFGTNFNYTPIPEPASVALLAVAMGGVVAGIRRRTKK
jgi:hypothetical protein